MSDHKSILQKLIDDPYADPTPELLQALAQMYVLQSAKFLMAQGNGEEAQPLEVMGFVSLTMRDAWNGINDSFQAEHIRKHGEQ